MEKLTANFNGIDILKDRNDLLVCCVCGIVLNKWDIALDCKKKVGMAFSISRDGYWMVHPRFKEVCDEAGLFGGKFVKLSSSYFVLIPLRIIKIKQWLEKRKLCPECGNYELVAVNGPPRLAEDEVPPAPLELTRSNLEYGNKAMRAFDIWVGNEAADILRAARLRGLDFTEHSYPGMKRTTRIGPD